MRELIEGMKIRIKHNANENWVYNMNKFRGTIMTIKDVSSPRGVRCKEDSGRYFFNNSNFDILLQTTKLGGEIL